MIIKMTPQVPGVSTTNTPALFCDLAFTRPALEFFLGIEIRGALSTGCLTNAIPYFVVTRTYTVPGS